MGVEARPEERPHDLDCPQAQCEQALHCLQWVGALLDPPGPVSEPVVDRSVHPVAPVSEAEQQPRHWCQGWPVYKS